MNIKELKRELKEKDVPLSYYNIDGIGETDQKMCLEYVNNLWYMYYSEKGQKFDVSTFMSEEEACEELYKRLVD